METLNVSRQVRAGLAVRGGLVVVPKVDGLWQVWERPLVGHRYLISARPGGLKKVVGGRQERERSVVMVLRQSYLEEGSERWFPHRLVARVVAPLNLDPTPLAELVAMGAEWYGDCLCFCEVKDGAIFAQECQRLGAAVQVREVLHKTTSEWTREIGWLTDEESGPAAINALVNAIRATGQMAEVAAVGDVVKNALRVECEHCLAELSTFSPVESDVPAVSHDDDVRALATGIYNIESATIIHPHTRAKRGPADGWKVVDGFGGGEF